MCWNEILSYAIPFGSIMLSFFFGVLTSRSSDKKAANEKRYYNLYVPFIRNLAGDAALVSDSAALDNEARIKYLNIAAGNVEFLGTKSAKMYYDYYLSAGAVDSRWTYSSEERIGYERIYLDRFRSFSLALLDEASALSKSLRLPDIAAIIATSDFQQMLELHTKIVQEASRSKGPNPGQ